MKKGWIFLTMFLGLLLCGCEVPADRPHETTVATVATEATIPVTIPADGNPEDVTCKGSYTGAATDEVVATCGSASLTNRQLQVWYWAEVAQYRQENHEVNPYPERPLDTQVCDIDDSVHSWQQYFLKRALSAWHSSQALVQQSIEVPLATEEPYQPSQKHIEQYMTGMPASEVLYGYYSHYRPNSMHQAYLDKLPENLEILAREKGYAGVQNMAEKAFGTTEEALEAFAETYNRGYMYFTHLSHYIEPTTEDVDAFYEQTGPIESGEISVDFRQILLIPQDVLEPDDRPNWKKKQEPKEPVVLETVRIAPDGKVTCSEEAWSICEQEAQEMLTYWQKKNRGTEATFGETANKHTADPGTKVNGGRYQNIRKGQMTAAVDNWCFDPARQVGDTAVLRSDYGVHILYFSGSRSVSREEAEETYYRQEQSALITEAKVSYPMEVAYSAITLQDAEAQVSFGDILYPDIAHERFPEIPLYLQQDYPDTNYGGFTIRHNGCGITSFAMLASYLADDELTPPEMCARYGRYSHSNGTDGLLFNYEPSGLGFYLREKTYEPRIAKQALEEGHVVISVQHPGYWTTAGHYIVCESMNAEGLVQVRDSNIYNYARVPAHKEDLHKWGNVVRAGSGYWIYDHKITRIPACSRCGDPQGVTESLLNWDYICEKCSPAILRRTTYLGA